MTLIRGDFYAHSGDLKRHADLIYTDPNYGVTACKFDERPFDEILFFVTCNQILRPGGVVLLHSAMPFTAKLFRSVRASEWWKYEWVWEKSNATGHMMAKRRPLKAHETVQVFVKPGAEPTYNPQMVEGKPYTWNSRRTQSEHFENRKNEKIVNSGQRYPRSVLHVKQERGLHPTQKPVEFAKYLINTYTNAGDLVVDPFMGSGTAAVAARDLKRKFWGCEIVPKYFNTARKRCPEKLKTL